MFRQSEQWSEVLSVRFSLGALSYQMQDYPAARAQYEQCVSLSRNLQPPNPKCLRLSLYLLTIVAAHQGDVELARRLGRECLKLALDTDDVTLVISALMALGSVAADLPEARSHFTKALSLSRKCENADMVTACLCSLGHQAEPGRDNDDERKYLEECLEYCSISANKRSLSYALNNMGNVEHYAGNLEQAEKLYHESLSLKQVLEDEWAIAYTLEGCAALAATRGNGERAARLFGAAEAIRERLGTPLEPSKRHIYEACVAKAKTLLDAAAFEKAWQESKTLSWAQAVVNALS